MRTKENKSQEKNDETDVDDSDSEDDEMTVNQSDVPSAPTALPTQALLQDQALQDITTDLNIALDIPHDIEMSDNPFDAFERRRIYLYGSHPTAGLKLKDDDLFQAPLFLEAMPAHPAAKMPAIDVYFQK